MVLLLVLILILLLIINYKEPELENFNGKLSNVDAFKCGRFCTTSYDCAGFAYDVDTKSCYIGKSYLTKPNEKNDLYYDEYNPKQQICNKLAMIRSDNLSYNNDIYKNNSLYRCSDNIENKVRNILIDDTHIFFGGFDKLEGHAYKLDDIKYPDVKKDFLYNDI